MKRNTMVRYSRSIRVSFLERQDGTDPHCDARKACKMCTLSKHWRVHEAMAYFTLYSYKPCGPVRTLSERDGQDKVSGTVSPRSSLPQAQIHRPRSKNGS
jgi:hypothetical protein